MRAHACEVRIWFLLLLRFWVIRLLERQGFYQLSHLAGPAWERQSSLDIHLLRPMSPEVFGENS